MDEYAALDVTAVRALETGDSERTLWSDADREWASRAAAEVVGEGADGETFLACRARLVLERIGARSAAVPRAARALRWRPWVGWLVIAGAFFLGVAVDCVGGVTHINLLAPPVMALLLWNVVVYAALVAGLVVPHGRPGRAGPLRALLIRLAAERGRGGRGDRGGSGGGSSGLRAILAALPGDWARIAAPLYAVRAARILHLAAATTALGVIAGLYVRGLAFEYRATWESTFLDAAQVRALLAAALAPGALLTGIAVPSVAALEAIRAPGSENAAAWLHLLAASVAAVVVVPRLLLAVGVALVERRRATHVDVPLSDEYYRRLLRGYRGAAVRVRVIPYSYAAPQAALAGIEAIVARAFGSSAALTVDAPLAWGDDEAMAARPLLDGEDPVIALFNATATPEREAHGAFVAALAAGAEAARPVVAIVDESAFRARWPGQDRRLTERRAAWKDLFAESRVQPMFIDLAAPDLAAAEAALDAALVAHDADLAARNAPPAPRDRGRSPGGSAP